MEFLLKLYSIWNIDFHLQLNYTVYHIILRIFDAIGKENVHYNTENICKWHILHEENWIDPKYVPALVWSIVGVTTFPIILLVVFIWCCRLTMASWKVNFLWHNDDLWIGIFLTSYCSQFHSWCFIHENYSFAQKCIKKHHDIIFPNFHLELILNLMIIIKNGHPNRLKKSKIEKFKIISNVFAHLSELHVKLCLHLQCNLCIQLGVIRSVIVVAR